MFFSFSVSVPPSEGKITFKKRKDAVYAFCAAERTLVRLPTDTRRS